MRVVSRHDIFLLISCECGLRGVGRMSERSRLTPYDDGFASCVETRCVLRIYPGDLEPQEVSTQLGIEPTLVNVAGRVRVNSLGLERTIPKNGWFLSSEADVDSLDLRRHLDWLIHRLEPVGESLKRLQQLPSLRMNVTCAWYSRSGHGGPTLWPEQMAALAALGLECSFDAYFLEDEE